MNKPKHQHDCDKCKFLGQATLDGQMCDWYVRRHGAAEQALENFKDNVLK